MPMKPRRHTEESGKSKVCFVFFFGLGSNAFVV